MVYAIENDVFSFCDFCFVVINLKYRQSKNLAGKVLLGYNVICSLDPNRFNVINAFKPSGV